MLTTEIKINGIMIAHLYAVNKGSHHDTEYNLYKFEYTRFGEGFVHRGNILHRQADGAEVLISKILKLVQHNSHVSEEQNEVL